MKDNNAWNNYKKFKRIFVPLFKGYLRVNGQTDFSLKYNIPHSMMHKADSTVHAHALPPSFERKGEVFELVCVDEDWMLILKISNLLRSLDGQKTCKDIATAFYYIIDSLSAFKKPWQITSSDFVRASQKDGLLRGQKHRVGAGLCYLAKMYNDYSLSTEIINYLRNPHPRPIRSDKSLLPDLEACKVIAESFGNPRNGFEVLVTSAFSFLNYAPSRSSEIVTLSLDCITSLDGFGLRFPNPAKNGQAVVKRSPCVEFEQVVRVGVERLVEYGKSARQASAWYEENRESLFIPEGFEHLSGQEIYSATEALQIIGYEREDGEYTKRLYSNRTSSPLRLSMPPGLGRLFEGKDIDSSRDYVVDDRSSYIRHEKLLGWVLSKLLPTFPFVDGVSGVKYSECLFVYPYSSRSPVTKVFWKCSNVPSFFTTSKLQMWLSRLFFRGRDLGHLSIGTHEMRHLLNTLAQTKHIDQRIISMWSGRSCVQQNEAYDHRTPLEKIELVDVGVLGGGFEFGGFLDELYESQYKTEGVSTEQFLKNVVGSLHVTELGYCRHDYNSGPCPNVFQCIDCSEHCFTKGDERSLQAAHRMAEKLSPVIDAARIAYESGEPGAEQFLRSHENKMTRLTKQIRLLQDPVISDGALCALTPQASSDNIVTKVIKMRLQNSARLIMEAHENGRVQHSGMNEDVIDKFVAMMQMWSFENGLPTWENIINTFRMNASVTIRRDAILNIEPMYEAYERLGKRLLSSSLMKRDSSLRWYWNYEVAISLILRDWCFESSGTPSLKAITNCVTAEFPYMEVTAMALEKNDAVRCMLAAKKQELHDSGFIFLSRRGHIVCERGKKPDVTEGLSVYECYSKLSESWSVFDGLPSIPNVLIRFAECSGFVVPRSTFAKDREFLDGLQIIQNRLRFSGMVKFNRIGVPSWNIDKLLYFYLSQFTVSESAIDTSNLYDKFIKAFSISGLKFSRFCSALDEVSARRLS